MASFGITSPTAMLDKLIEEQRYIESGHCLSGLPRSRGRLPLPPF
jgi:hypothetical protein